MIFNVRASIFKDPQYYINSKPKLSCSNSPPTEIKIDKNNSRIIAVGDIHGDFHTLLHALYKAKVINKNSEWIGGATIVIQLGDQLDKGGRGSISVDHTNDSVEELKIIEFLHNLHFQALANGGGVYSLIGNHELMNIMGDFRYVSPLHIDGFGGYEQRKELFKPGGALAVKLACNTNGIMKIGDWIFVHAGLLPEHIENFTLGNINKIVRDILLGKTNMNNIGPEIYDLMFNQNSLFWNRYYTIDTNPEKCKILNKTLNILNIGKTGGMVVGHTPQKHITSGCNNKLWMADVGMSSAFGSKNNNSDRVEILEIINNGKIINVI
uniref:Calcineurin-like phosphoesterase domain-containing protein n=1 Tax=viral metagenome TaxID=1070528 RepID=A0A6C0EI77_9ZZZZ